MGIEKRKLGQMNIDVFPIAFGCGAISGEGGGYGFGPVWEKEALALLHRAFELGINVFDAAPIYGYGLAEKRLGMAFHKQREKVFLVSKGGVSWHPNKRVNMSNDPQIIEAMLDKTLSDMQTEYVDLYMIHWPDSQVDIRRPMAVLSRAKRLGKIRSIGLSNTNREDVAKAMEVEQIEVIQNEFNLFERAALTDIFPLCEKQGMGFMSWGTFDKGILTGRVKTENQKFDKLDVRSWAPWWKQEKESRQAKFKAMEKIRLMLSGYGYSELQLALAHNLSFPTVSTAICGVRTMLQLEETVEALDHLPGEEVLQKAREIAQSFGNP